MEGTSEWSEINYDIEHLDFVVNLDDATGKVNLCKKFGKE